VRDEFAPDDPSAVSGCFFHWKQLLRRKLVDLRVPSEIIHQLMDELIDFLTILLYNEIPKGIAYVRSRMHEGQFKAQFDSFWAYFMKNFMKKTTRYDDHSGLYLFTSWNISHLVDDDGQLIEEENGHSVLVNRTNNPLERFNRKLNERIPRHPTVQVLVSILKDISNEYVDLMKDIRLRRYRQKPHPPVPIPVFPSDFASFKFK
jgi:hypothetical protein